MSTQTCFKILHSCCIFPFNGQLSNWFWLIIQFDCWCWFLCISLLFFIVSISCSLIRLNRSGSNVAYFIFGFRARDRFNDRYFKLSWFLNGFKLSLGVSFLIPVIVDVLNWRIRMSLLMINIIIFFWKHYVWHRCWCNDFVLLGRNYAFDVGHWLVLRHALNNNWLIFS